MKVYIKTKVKPTENKNKVIKAVKNIFPNIKLEGKKEEELIILEGETSNLNKFKEMIRRQAILDTARMILEENLRGNSTTFYLNKQAAYVNNINFDIDTHGGIFVKIVADENEDIKKIIKDIAPRTKHGKIIVEEDEEEGEIFEQ
ncbi:RNA-binding domain-containing protein [Methanocaldococcus indicus]|uniref:RNA-binding domain-containing protein n=1 Tax=Methanocaldococcus indicus TaxID=213231 RepID=UPI003C6CFFFB